MIFNSIFLLFFQEGGSNFFCFHFIIDRCIGAWNRRNTKLIGDTLGINFVAKILDNLPVRSDKRQGTISVCCPAGKPEVFWKETVSRMYCRAGSVVSNWENIIWFCITGYSPGILLTTGGSLAHDVFWIFVCISINDNIIEAQVLAGFHDADGNFTPVGDEYLSFHINPLRLKFYLDTMGADDNFCCRSAPRESSLENPPNIVRSLNKSKRNHSLIDMIRRFRNRFSFN